MGYTDDLHMTTLHHAGTDPDQWFAECECGWRGTDCEDEDEAENEATGHQVEQAAAARPSESMPGPGAI